MVNVEPFSVIYRYCILRENKTHYKVSHFPSDWSWMTALSRIGEGAGVRIEPEPGAAADRRSREGEDDPLAAKERVQGPNQAWLKTAAPVRRRRHPWLWRRGCRARTRRGWRPLPPWRWRRPPGCEGEDAVFFILLSFSFFWLEPGVAEERRSREGEGDPLAAQETV